LQQIADKKQTASKLKEQERLAAQQAHEQYNQYYKFGKLNGGGSPMRESPYKTIE